MTTAGADKSGGLWQGSGVVSCLPVGIGRACNLHSLFRTSTIANVGAHWLVVAIVEAGGRFDVLHASLDGKAGASLCLSLVIYGLFVLVALQYG